MLINRISREIRHKDTPVSNFQDFERFNGYFRCMKSWLLQDGEATSIQTVHRGADLNCNVEFKNHHLRLERAKHRTNTKSTAEVMVDRDCIKCDVEVHKGKYFILNAPCAPFGDAFCGLDTTERNEVHQYKYYKKQKLSKADFFSERQKAALEKDFFC